MSPSEKLPEKSSIANADEIESDEDVEIEESSSDVSAYQQDGPQNTDKDAAIEEERHSYEITRHTAGEDEQVESSGINATDNSQSELNGAERRSEGAAQEAAHIAEQQVCPEDVASESGDEILSERNELPEKRHETPVSSDEPIENDLHQESSIPAYEAGVDKGSRHEGSNGQDSTLQEHSPQKEPAAVERRYGIEELEIAARRYLDTTSLYDLESLMWSLVAADDLSAAYWISEYLDENEYEAALPAGLLKALQGSRWLTPDSYRYVDEMRSFATMYELAEDSGAQELLELAASLHSSLIAPSSNMLGLLRVPAICPEAGPVVAAINEFARTGNALRPEYVEGMGESVRRQDEIAAASERANTWLEEAPDRRYNKFPRATNVWRYLTTDDGALSELLAAVIRDDRTQVQYVRNLIGSIEGGEIGLVNHANQLLAEGSSPIIGTARNWLLNRIAEGKSLAERWCELVDYENEVQIGAQDSYLVQQVTNLRNEIQRHSRHTINSLQEMSTNSNSLQEMSTNSNPVEIASAAQSVLRSMNQLVQSLDLTVDIDIPDAAAAI